MSIFSSLYFIHILQHNITAVLATTYLKFFKTIFEIFIYRSHDAIQGEAIVLSRIKVNCKTLNVPFPILTIRLIDKLLIKLINSVSVNQFAFGRVFLARICNQTSILGQKMLQEKIEIMLIGNKITEVCLMFFQSVMRVQYEENWLMSNNTL